MKNNNVKQAALTLLVVAVLSVAVIFGVKSLSSSNGGNGGGSAAAYTPGTYEGTGKGFGTITVSVTVDESSITAVEINGPDETPGIGGKEAIEAGTFTEAILAAQSTSIDTVSGATMTSNGVIEAVNNALAQARGEAE